MSIVAFDGKKVFYDSICVGGGFREFTVEKVHVSNDKRLVSCSVGVWGMACSVVQDFFDRTSANPELLEQDIFIPSTELSEKVLEDYSGDIIIIDTVRQRLWLYDEYINGFGAVPYKPFIIGHERAQSIVALSIDATDDNKWDKIAFDLSVVQNSHHFNDRVTAAPYKVIDLASMETHTV